MKKSKFKSDRRQALRGLATTPALAAAAVASSQAQAAGTVEPVAEKPEQKGYHETQHIRDYYRSASF